MTRPHRLTLGELIAALEAEDSRKRLRTGFTHPHSWRGDYWQLAFEVTQDIAVGAMLAHARHALDRTFTGWRGGEFTMDEHVDVYLVTEEGTSDGESLGSLLLGYMLADVVEAPRV